MHVRMFTSIHFQLKKIPPKRSSRTQVVEFSVSYLPNGALFESMAGPRPFSQWFRRSSGACYAIPSWSRCTHGPMGLYGIFIPIGKCSIHGWYRIRILLVYTSFFSRRYINCWQNCSLLRAFQAATWIHRVRIFFFEYWILFPSLKREEI